MLLFCLRHPIRQHRQRAVRLFRVVAGQVNLEIVFSIHAFVHHELHRELCTLTRLEYHRTDGRGRRSTPFHDFDIRLLTEPQGLVANIRNFEGNFDRLA